MGDEEVHVTVKTEGEDYIFLMSPKDKIALLMRLLSGKLNIPFGDVQLVHEGNIVNGKKKLNSFKTDEVEFVLILPEGKGVGKGSSGTNRSQPY